MELGKIVVMKSKNFYVTKKEFTLTEAKIEIATTQAALRKNSIGRNKRAWFLSYELLLTLPDCVTNEYISFLDKNAVVLK